MASAGEDAVAGARIRMHRRLPPGSASDGVYEGRHYTEWVETIASLKRSGAFEELREILLCLIDAVEDEAAVQGWGVAPWYYE